MEEFIKSILDYLLANYELYLVVTMSIIIALTITLLTFIKKPIKSLTSKIQNEKLRALANKTFIVIAFGLSALIWLVLSWCSSHYFSFDWLRVLLTGSFSIVVYAFGDKLVTKPTADKLVELVKEIDSDKKLDGNDKSAVKEFYNTIK